LVVVVVVVFVVVSGVNERFKSRLRIPIPAELIVVILGTGVSYGVRLHSRYFLAIIGVIPSGIPYPSVPPLTPSSPSNYLLDALLIAVVGFVIGVTMAKLMGSRHKYEIGNLKQ